MHTLADVGHIGKDGLLVPLTHDLWRRDGVTPAGRSEESGVGDMELAVEPMQELRK